MKQIEDTFKDFTTRDNVAIVLINQFVSDICPLSCSIALTTSQRRRNLQYQAQSKLRKTKSSLLRALQVANLIRHQLDNFISVSGAGKPRCNCAAACRLLWWYGAWGVIL